MRPNDSPFSNVGPLHKLPFSIDGSFAWLASTGTHEEHIGKEKADELPANVDALRAASADLSFELPKEFLSFLSNPSHHKHLRSVTDCFLDVTEEPLPFSGGYLVRFLADSQGCMFWYLYVNRTGTEHAVVASQEYFETDDMDFEVDEITESHFFFVAESFEAFVCRFWLENEIQFANFDETPLPNVDAELLTLYAQ